MDKYRVSFALQQSVFTRQEHLEEMEEAILRTRTGTKSLVTYTTCITYPTLTITLLMQVLPKFSQYTVAIGHPVAALIGCVYFSIPVQGDSVSNHPLIPLLLITDHLALVVGLVYFRSPWNCTFS